MKPAQCLEKSSGRVRAGEVSLGAKLGRGEMDCEVVGCEWGCPKREMARVRFVLAKAGQCQAERSACLLSIDGSFSDGLCHVKG